jgi:carboxyl-terminal processing protease
VRDGQRFSHDVGLRQRRDRGDARESGERMQGIVLDLRQNPGGSLDEAGAVRCSDRATSCRSAVGLPRKTVLPRRSMFRGDVAAGFPVVVLIDAGSASASKSSPSLQDQKRALIMGDRSFVGLGHRHRLDHPRDEATTARYFTLRANRCRKAASNPVSACRSCPIPSAKRAKMNPRKRPAGHLINEISMDDKAGN